MKTAPLIAGLLAMFLATPLAAQNLPDAKSAAKMLFSTRAKAVRAVVIKAAFLSQSDLQSLTTVAKLQKYYTAIAVSPSGGITGDAAAAATNFHSIEAARAAATVSCNAKKKRSDKPCEIVAETLPDKYTDRRAFQLNPDATDAFKKKYRRAKSPKAFATSQQSGMWGQAVKAGSIEAARAAAVAQCQSKAASAGVQAKDCQVVSEN